MLIFLNLLFLFSLTKISVTATTQYGQYFWVLANDWESHAIACARIGLLPTPKIIPIELNSTALTYISNSLGYNYSGISGCCSYSLWCNNKTGSCYTHSLGLYYENQGWVVGKYTEIPLFSCETTPTHATQCTDPMVDAISLVPTTWDFDYTTTNTLTGYNFGLEENVTSVSIAGQDCQELEICNHVCAVCDANSQCPLDSECLLGNEITT